MNVLQAMLALFLAFLSAFNIFDKDRNEVPSSPSTQAFEFLEYPEEAVKSLSSAGLTTATYTKRADDDGDELYVNAQGYQDISGIIKSPYFSAYIEAEAMPVYATNVFVGNTQKGALHSFCEVYVDTTREVALDFQLNTHGFVMEKVNVFPKSANISPTFLNTVLNFEITELGTYTFVFNGDDQEHGFTLFVRELVDEEKEIQRYQNMGYNVIPVEKGFHNSDAYFDFCGWSNTVFYLKRGSYLQAKHVYDITSDADNYNNTALQDTDLMNAGHLPMGLNRCPYLNLTGCSNVKIVGSGVIDLSHLDRAERRGIVIAYASNIEISGVKFINSPEWTFITYDSEDIIINDVDIFGYRQNSDAFAICNSRNVTVYNSFCRSGDDLFDVKACGGREEAISQNITFSNCTAWNGKARCFGICGEVEKDIKDVTFKDSTVVFHDATWNADRIPALAIVVEIGGGSIDNVKFENIEIYRAYSRAVGCLIYGDDVQNCNISNIKYKDIHYTAPKKNKIASNGKQNSIQVEFENVYSSGSKIKTLSTDHFEYDSYASITVK